MFIQYRKSPQYQELKTAHIEEFKIYGYEPEAITVDDESAILEEFEEDVDKI